jgi:hypothetical protein
MPALLNGIFHAITERHLQSSRRQFLLDITMSLTPSMSRSREKTHRDRTDVHCPLSDPDVDLAPLR